LTVSSRPDASYVLMDVIEAPPAGGGSSYVSIDRPALSYKVALTSPPKSIASLTSPNSSYVVGAWRHVGPAGVQSVPP
jgi:hypothetical protein